MPPIHSARHSVVKLFLALLPTISNALPVEYHPIKQIVTPMKTTPLTETEFYMYAITSSCLVLLGGVFAGLTLGLMGQDEVYLKVISTSGTDSERECSLKVLELLDKGKHWLLVTLLLSNVITNETLPVILDRLLGGGFAAVFSSTVAIVIFGEIIPQSICVRYGLELGAFFAPYVLILMYILYPIAYPIAKLLDYILGEDHGTLYRKNGLKTLVNLHHTMGTDRLNSDEVTIINSVLDLKSKPVSVIMTPISKVFTLPSDKILDEKTVEEIFNAGYSRIPIHFPGEPYNFVGMLLVRILISYDPEDDLPISSFPLATLPETSLYTSCLNILNYFQEGKSHMVIVSENPGHDTGAKGVLTLEDVIEELIGEEIVDESDVYIDVNKDIKRTIPGPLAKRNVTSYLHKLYNSSSKLNTVETRSNSLPKTSAYISKDAYERNKNKSVPGIKPSNLASDPLKTKNSHITIKKQPELLSPNFNTANSNNSNHNDTITSDNNKTSNKSHIDGSYTKELTPLSLSDHDTNNGEYGSVNGNVNGNADNESHQVHSSEAAALVQGIFENVERHSSKCTDPQDCNIESGALVSKNLKLARRSFLNSSYGIPVPKVIPPEANNNDESDIDNYSFNGSPGGGIFENNIISLKGVSKTIIHDNNFWDKKK